ncbi:hypothetical protein AUC70_14320 [Methyloceanibacter stevinii]|uniref:DUF5330 domain-containing protein n=1 Tax=Methyloceanibacter stevinii TaxID=1774970 RepID=A0A1E3VTR5_9HYPH|nr:DUF5330 domain-containing protein [Methyloceanibacter stevinii]ODR96940.1 hypothetical protein AUC70_14320 [Methyloceanibacter stevinii]
MMFLIRSAFWLVVLILLIPTDGEQQKKIYGMAQTAVADIRSFCVRNPETCDSGQFAINVLVQKAQYGAHMVQSLVNDQTGTFAPARYPDNSQQAAANRPSAHQAPVDNSVMPVPSAVPIEPTPWIDSGSQNTLSPEDLKTEWSGPNV